MNAVQAHDTRHSPWRRLHDELFRGPLNSLLTLFIAAGLALLVPRVIDWALAHAVFRPDADACRAAEHVGACWGVIAEKLRPILFGRYPHDAHWRPAACVALMIALAVVCGWPRSWRPALILLWVGVLAIAIALMRGGLAGLEPVPTSRWGGLPLTLLLTYLGLSFAFPLGVLLALGRRSDWPAVHSVCVIYIELVRGVPMISVLFMASFMLPLMLPPGLQVDVLLRVLVGITLFAAAYLAEVVRGGLQSVPRGQLEAARALGLTAMQAHRHVVLPQALKAVVPALVNSFIGVFKDTSLVSIVSLYELTGALTLALGGDTTWRPFYLEGYLFVALIYFVMCSSLSRYSRYIERRLNTQPAHLLKA